MALRSEDRSLNLGKQIRPSVKKFHLYQLKSTTSWP